MTKTPLFGLVLAGGDSRRMRIDKAAIEIGGVTQLRRAYDLLSRHCEKVFVSVRTNQAEDPERQGYPLICDVPEDIGPVAGILAAFESNPEVAWLVAACDLPLLDDMTLMHLVKSRDVNRTATAFRSSHDALPEPMCAIYEPVAKQFIRAFVDDGLHCPRKMLIRSNVRLLTQPNPDALENMNSPEDLERMTGNILP